MTIVKSNDLLPGQSPVVGRSVLCQSTNEGFSGDGQSRTIFTASVRTDETGMWSFDLAAGVYVITEPDKTRWTVSVPASGGPYYLSQVLTVDPPQPVPVVTGLTVDEVVEQIADPGSPIGAAASAAYVQLPEVDRVDGQVPVWDEDAGAWVSGPGGGGGSLHAQVWVDDFGADRTGVADSTAAFLAALSSLPTVTVYPTPATSSGTPTYTYRVGTLRLSSGRYKLGSSGDVGNLGPFVSVLGDGHNSTILDYRGAGDCLRIYSQVEPSSDTFDTLSSWGGVLDRFTIDGTSAQAGAVGLHYGDLEGGVLGPDLWVNNFTGAGSVGVLFDNAVSWTENIYGRLVVRNCTTCVRFAVTTGDVSFMYNDLTLKLYVWPNQDGLDFEGGADYSSGFLAVKANCLRSTTANAGSLIKIGARTASKNNRLVNTRWDIQAETNGGSAGGTNAHKTINFVDGNYQFLQSTGIWAFGGFAASNSTKQLDFAGFIVGDAALYNGIPAGVQPRNLLTENQSTAATDATAASSPTNCTVGRDTSVVPQYGVDAASYTVTSTAAGNMTYKLPAVTALAGALMAVTALALPATTARQGRVEVDWLTSGNAYISTTTGTTVTQNANSWTVLSLLATAPATAAKAQIKVAVFAAGAASEVHYVARVNIARVA